MHWYKFCNIIILTTARQNAVHLSQWESNYNQLMISPINDKEREIEKVLILRSRNLSYFNDQGLHYLVIG